MTISFRAKFVDCLEAIGGDLIQVSFDTIPDSEEEDNRASPYVIIGRLFEFPGAATIEWHDGSDYDGGAEIVSASLRRDGLMMRLDRDVSFEITFQISDKRFTKLASSLRMMLEDNLTCSPG